MSEQRPEELRRDIEQTRGEMDQTLAQIEDRVSPSRIRERQVERVRGRWDRARATVMGEDGSDTQGRAGQLGDRAGEMSDRAGGAAQQASERAKEAPDRMEEMTRGNPLAAGLIAFGLGALVGSLAPSSAPERQLASGLRDEFEEPVKSELQSAGEGMKEDLQEHAQEAVEETKRTAKGAADRTTEEARDRAEDVRGEAEQAADNVQEQRN